MKKRTILRDYQLEMLDRLHLAWEKHQSVMVQMPTGVGKTVLLAEEIRNERLRVKGSRVFGVLVVAHRIELIDQISRTLDKFGIEHGLIVCGKPVDETKQVQVASIQTLSRRLGFTNGSSEGKNIDFDYTPSLIIIDEAHHALAKTYKMLWA